MHAPPLRPHYGAPPLAAFAAREKEPMNLLQRGLWWIVPLIVVAGIMVYSMVAFTTALLVRRGHRKPIDEAELAHRLLALKDPQGRWHVVDRGRDELELVFDVVDSRWRSAFARVKLDIVYRARMLLDAATQELRWFEVLRAGGWLVGFYGFRPRFNVRVMLQAGYIDVRWRGVAYGILPGFPPRIGSTRPFELDTVALEKAVVQLVTDAGWAFRPTTLPWQVSGRWVALVRALTPAWLRAVPRRRSWGVLYIGSFVAFYVYLFVGLMNPATDWSANNLLIGAGIAVVWWTIWGGLTWLLLGRPSLQRKRRRRAESVRVGGEVKTPRRHRGPSSSG